MVSIDQPASTLMDTWPSWCTKLEKYASLEAKSRPTLGSLISDLEGCQKETNEGTVTCMHILY